MIRANDQAQRSEADNSDKINMSGNFSSWNSKTPAHSGAFTLTELLVVLAVVCMLLVVWIPARADMGRKAGIVECKNNLRQVGAAIDMFAQDHTNYLPGPIWIGVYYNYQSANSGNGSMAYYLATYLGMPAPGLTNQEVEALKCPAAIQALPPVAQVPPLSVPVCFLATTQITNNPGRAPADVVSYPFGRPSAPSSSPVQISRIKRPSEEPMMSDVDQTGLIALGYTAATYFSYVPAQPVHNNRPGGPGPVILRNSLFFDGSVRTIKSSR